MASDPASPLSIHDAAQRLGLEPVALRALIHAKRVPAFRDNQNRWRVRIDASVTEAIAKAPAAERTPSPTVLSEEIAELTALLRDQTTLVGALKALLARQDALAERFETVAQSALAERDHVQQHADALDAHLRHSLDLLTRAIERGESLSERQVALQGKLDRAVGLLEQSVSGQERIAGAAGQAASGFERSLDLLENASSGVDSASGQPKAQQLENQLNRALDLVDSMVAGKGQSPTPGGSDQKRGLFSGLRKLVGSRP